MKVLMVSKSCVAEAHHGKLKELARLGVQLTVITPPRWGIQKAEIREATDYRLRILPCWFAPYNHFHFYPGSIGKIDADLVYLEEEPWSLVTQQFLHLSIKHRKPVVFFSWQNIQKRYPPPFNLFERRTFYRAHAAIAGTETAKKILRDRGFTKPVTVAAIGIDPTIFVKRYATSLRQKLGLEDAFIIGYIGRMVVEKGIEDLLRAFAMLPSSCVLVMVGDGPFRERAQTLAAELGLASRVRWLLQIDSLQVADYTNLLDVLVLPSRTTPRWKEQFGRVLVEAMACEKPPVGSDSGEIPSVIGDAGLVFPEGNADAMAKQLRCLLENPDLRARLGSRGRARVLENYTHKRIAELNLELYREVLAIHGASAANRVMV